MNRFAKIILGISSFALAASSAIVVGGGVLNNKNPAKVNADYGLASPELKADDYENIRKTACFYNLLHYDTPLLDAATFKTDFVCDSPIYHYTLSDSYSVFDPGYEPYVPVNDGYTASVVTKTIKRCFSATGSATERDDYVVRVQSKDTTKILTINLNAPFLVGGIPSQGTRFDFDENRMNVEFIGKFRFILAPISSSTYPQFISTNGDLNIMIPNADDFVYVEAVKPSESTFTYYNIPLISSTRMEVEGPGTLYINNTVGCSTSSVEFITYSGAGYPDASYARMLCLGAGASFYVTQSSTSELIFKSQNYNAGNVAASIGTSFYNNNWEQYSSSCQNDCLLFMGYSSQSSHIPSKFTFDTVSSVGKIIGSYDTTPSASSQYHDCTEEKTEASIGANFSCFKISGQYALTLLLIGKSSASDLVYFDATSGDASGITGLIPPATKKTVNSVSTILFSRGGEYTPVSGWGAHAWYTSSTARDNGHFFVPGATSLSGITSLYAGYDCNADFIANKLLMGSTTENQCVAAMPAVIAFLNANSSANGATYAGWRTRFLEGSDLTKQGDPTEYAKYPERVKRLINWAQENGYVVSSDANEGFVVTQASNVSTVAANNTFGSSESVLAIITIALTAIIASITSIIIIKGKRKREE